VVPAVRGGTAEKSWMDLFSASLIDKQGVTADMSCKIISVDGGLLTVRLSNILRLAEQQAVQKIAEEMIGAAGKIRMLVIAENFEGWSREDDWNDMGFLMEYGDSVVKMAIVGEAHWKDDAYAFAGKGLRDTEIEFFAPSALHEAECWVRN
jgi:hypothetical protein